METYADDGGDAGIKEAYTLVSAGIGLVGGAIIGAIIGSVKVKIPIHYSQQKYSDQKKKLEKYLVR